jgi:hypothetical protein
MKHSKKLVQVKKAAKRVVERSAAIAVPKYRRRSQVFGSHARGTVDGCHALLSQFMLKGKSDG